MHLSPVCLAALILWQPPLAAGLCFVLFPLGLLLLLSSPRTLLEWLWIGVAVVAGVSWRSLPNDFSSHLTLGAALMLAGSFSITVLMGMQSLVHRALSAIIVTWVGLSAWYRHAGVDYATFRATLLDNLWVGLRSAIPTLPIAPPSLTSSPFATPAAPISGLNPSPTEIATTLSLLYPAYLAIGALAGLWLAWAAYSRVAAAPLGRPAAPFYRFAFNDHLIWVVVAAIGLTLVHLPEAWGNSNVNILVVLGALYGVRGLAILATLFAMVTPIQVFLLALIALLLFPATATVCVILGVADTWLDFRRRLALRGVSP